MHAVVAMLKHETNTFSPISTPLAAFGRSGPVSGAAVLDAYRGTNTAIGGLLAAGNRAGLTMTTPIAAAAAPSGRADDVVFEALAAPILRAVETGTDIVLLDLHGAMATTSFDDAEGELLRRIRALRPGIPIAVALDLHANMSPAMVANASVMTGYRTYPHIDMAETGARAVDLLLQGLAAGQMPAMALARVPMLSATLRMRTNVDPMRSIMAAAATAVAGSVRDVSVFGGFPLADVACAGSSVVAIAADQSVAAAAAGKIADVLWAARESFVQPDRPLAESIAQAKASARHPVFLIDHADNSASGGTQDTMAVVVEAMRQRLDDMVVFAIADPDAVAECFMAGVDATVAVDLGGKIDFPALGLKGKSARLTGRVTKLSDGEFTIKGPMQTGVKASLGRTAVFSVGRTDIVICERRHEPWDVECLRFLGIEPTRREYVLLKSRVHFRATFEAIAGEIVECDGEGVATSRLRDLNFARVRRPIHPLDRDLCVDRPSG